MRVCRAAGELGRCRGRSGFASLSGAGRKGTVQGRGGRFNAEMLCEAGVCQGAAVKGGGGDTRRPEVE